MSTDAAIQELVRFLVESADAESQNMPLRGNPEALVIAFIYSLCYLEKYLPRLVEKKEKKRR